MWNTSPVESSEWQINLIKRSLFCASMLNKRKEIRKVHGEQCSAFIWNVSLHKETKCHGRGGIKKGPITKSFTQKVWYVWHSCSFHWIGALPEARVSLINRFIYRNNYKYEGAFETLVFKAIDKCFDSVTKKTCTQINQAEMQNCKSWQTQKMAQNDKWTQK